MLLPGKPHQRALIPFVLTVPKGQGRWHCICTQTNSRLLSPTNNLQLSDEWADAQIDVPGAGDVPATKGCLNSFALLKRKYTRLRVVLSVGGGGKGSEPFAAVARNPSSRARFAQTALGLVQQFGIDGIDSKHILLVKHFPNDC